MAVNATVRRDPAFIDAITALKQRLSEIQDLESAAKLLSWDQATYLPAGAAEARGRQLATINRLIHEKATDCAIGRLLDDLMPMTDDLPETCTDAGLLRVVRRNFERALKIPDDFVVRSATSASSAYSEWTRARPESDFAAMVPHLRRAVDLAHEYAGFFAPYDNVADPLITDADEGQTTASVRQLFDTLRRELVPMAAAILEQPMADDSCLKGSFSSERQMAFCQTVAKTLGYDFQRGRLDTTHHPFCTSLAISDVRITTRVYDDDISQALYSTIHEAGHGMYEQGVCPSLDGTPLAHGASMGVHESQSRLWENIVGRSQGFCAYLLPQLRETFPGQFEVVSSDMLYRAMNKVERSLIRTDADEVTYNLHVMLRFDLEIDMLEGNLAIADLPDAWNARIESDLGLTPPDDRDGCLQDVHWFAGGIGGRFQGYTIGNVLAAQLFAAAVEDAPEIPERIPQGDVAALRNWMNENIYCRGKVFTPNALIERACGKPMSAEPYLTYMREKYGELYKLPDRAQPD